MSKVRRVVGAVLEASYELAEIKFALIGHPCRVTGFNRVPNLMVSTCPALVLVEFLHNHWVRVKLSTGGHWISLSRGVLLLRLLDVISLDDQLQLNAILRSGHFHFECTTNWIYFWKIFDLFIETLKSRNLVIRTKLKVILVSFWYWNDDALFLISYFGLWALGQTELSTETCKYGMRCKPLVE